MPTDRERMNSPLPNTDASREGRGGRWAFVGRYWFEIPLWRRIIGAMAVGVVAGLIFGEAAVELKWIGDLFIRLIRMMVAPLIFVTIVSGMAAMSHVGRLGSIGLKTLGLYLATTMVSVAMGLALGALFQPGAGVDLAGVVPQAHSTQSISLLEQFIAIVPTNPIEALASGNVLSIIFFAVLVGAGILAVGDGAKPLVAVFDAGAAVLLAVTYFVMEVAPFGVFALIAWAIGTNGPEVFVHIFTLAACVIAGCIVQVLVIHGGLIRFVARLPVVPFFRDIVDVVVVAFSTSSSAATLPVALRVAQKNLGVSHSVASAALPIGTTISMDGTALYVGLLTVFSAQIFGIEMTLAQYLMAGLATTLVAIGSAPVPSASLFLLAGVLQTIGISAEQTALVVGFILPFDRILDMTRTVPNCTGDMAVAVTVARWEDELDVESYIAKPVE